MKLSQEYKLKKLMSYNSSDKMLIDDEVLSESEVDAAYHKYNCATVKGVVLSFRNKFFATDIQKIDEPFLIDAFNSVETLILQEQLTSENVNELCLYENESLLRFLELATIMTDLDCDAFEHFKSCEEAYILAQKFNAICYLLPFIYSQKLSLDEAIFFFPNEALYAQKLYTLLILNQLTPGEIIFYSKAASQELGMLFQKITVEHVSYIGKNQNILSDNLSENTMVFLKSHKQIIAPYVFSLSDNELALFSEKVVNGKIASINALKHFMSNSSLEITQFKPKNSNSSSSSSSNNQISPSLEYQIKFPGYSIEELCRTLLKIYPLAGAERLQNRKNIVTFLNFIHEQQLSLTDANSLVNHSDFRSFIDFIQVFTGEQAEHVVKQYLPRSLTFYQQKGMNYNLTLNQVDVSWFNSQHLRAAKAGYNYEQYKELTNAQVRLGILKDLSRENVIGMNEHQLMGMLAGLSYDQVNHDWFDYWHARAAREQVPYDQYARYLNESVRDGLLDTVFITDNPPQNNDLPPNRYAGRTMKAFYQDKGRSSGLLSEQVNKKWFGRQHALAAEKGYPYEEYQGLTDEQVKYGILKNLPRSLVIKMSEFQLRGMAAGLTSEQVNKKWFVLQHALAAERNFSYEEYQGLTEKQIIWGIFYDLPREYVIGMNEYQLRGMSAGLKYEQVNNDWFNFWHADAAEKNYSYYTYQELTNDQVGHGILKGLPRDCVINMSQEQIEGMVAGLQHEQVNNDWFDYWHARAAEEKYPYDTYQGLTGYQIRDGILKGRQRHQVENMSEIEVLGTTPYDENIDLLDSHQVVGMQYGLTRTQVEPEWFSCQHLYAAGAKIPYEKYQGLTAEQVELGILKGLSRQQVLGMNEYQLAGLRYLTYDQVNHQWFSKQHLLLAKKKVPYTVYEGLTDGQIEFGILYDLTRAEVMDKSDEEVKVLIPEEKRRDGLTAPQQMGMDNGLTRTQVNHVWFSELHATAACHKIAYNCYEQLTSPQVSGLIFLGLPRDQTMAMSDHQLTGMMHQLTYEKVNNTWFSEPHAEAATLCIPYTRYETLNDTKVKSVIKEYLKEQKGLKKPFSIEYLKKSLPQTREGLSMPIHAVRSKEILKNFYRYLLSNKMMDRDDNFLDSISVFPEKYFKQAFIQTAYQQFKRSICDTIYQELIGNKIHGGVFKDLSFEQVMDMTEHQLIGMRNDLSFEQVNNTWFSEQHAEAATQGIPYITYENLTKYQVRYGILQGLSRQQVLGMNEYQLAGLRYLTYNQVNHQWFSEQHLRLAEKQIPYGVYEGLTNAQIEFGILYDLHRDDVVNKDDEEVRALIPGEKKRDGLTVAQMQGMEYKLTRAQVEDELFLDYHADAAKILFEKAVQNNQTYRANNQHSIFKKPVKPKGDWFSLQQALTEKAKKDYELYKGLTKLQVFGGILLGLSRDQTIAMSDHQLTGMMHQLTYEQVSNAWFSEQHAEAATQGIPYKMYEKLNNGEVALAVKQYWKEERSKYKLHSIVFLEKSLPKVRARLNLSIQEALSDITSDKTKDFYNYLVANNIIDSEEISRFTITLSPEKYAMQAPIQEAYQQFKRSICDNIYQELTSDRIHGDVFKSLSFEQVMDMTEHQLIGMRSDLSFEQVNNAWFSKTHADAAKRGVPYWVYQNCVEIVESAVTKYLQQEKNQSRSNTSSSSNILKRPNSEIPTSIIETSSTKLAECFAICKQQQSRKRDVTQILSLKDNSDFPNKRKMSSQSSRSLKITLFGDRENAVNSSGGQPKEEKSSTLSGGY